VGSRQRSQCVTTIPNLTLDSTPAQNWMCRGICVFDLTAQLNTPTRPHGSATSRVSLSWVFIVLATTAFGLSWSGDLCGPEVYFL
jgi:hypothetical protein